MRSVRRLTPEQLPLTEPISDSVLTGEETLLRIGRSGFSVDYMPLPRAEWRHFPPAVTPEQVVGRPGCAAFAACEDGRPIGVCCVSATASGWCEVLDLRVDVSCRRTGAAGMMLDAAERFALDQGMRGLRITVPEDDPALCQFCQRKGFTLQGLDRYALIHTERERAKPLARRACALFYYRMLQG